MHEIQKIFKKALANAKNMFWISHALARSNVLSYSTNHLKPHSLQTNIEKKYPWQLRFNTISIVSPNTEKVKIICTSSAEENVLPRFLIVTEALCDFCSS